MRALMVAASLLVATRAFADEDMTGLDDRTQQMARSLNVEARPHFDRNANRAGGPANTNL